MAAGGYPDAYAQGQVISGLDDAVAEDCKVFHAGTVQQGEQVVTGGGRVLCVCALGETIQTAQLKAYETVKKIHWPEVYYRDDIGFKAIKSLS
jgi:phosphoribosylamine--glycine ligase